MDPEKTRNPDPAARIHAKNPDLALDPVPAKIPDHDPEANNFENIWFEENL